jgi:hypothetical protein
MVSLSKKIYNSPPRLVSPDNITMEEDEGMITVDTNWDQWILLLTVTCT